MTTTTPQINDLIGFFLFIYLFIFFILFYKIKLIGIPGPGNAS